MDNEWKVRLLGGVLHGREVWLSEGHLTIGERGCDLCVPLHNDGKIALSVMEGMLFIDAGGAGVLLNGRRHKHGAPLPEEGVVKAVGLEMAFGRHDADLSRYPQRTGMPAVLWGAALMFMALVGLSIVVLWTCPAVKAPESMSDRVVQLLHKKELTDTTTHWDRDGALVLSGYCQNSEAMQTVHSTLEAWGVLYRDTVVCSDQLIREVRDVLIQAGYTDAQVTITAPGEVHINADITMGKRWAAVQPQLSQLPGLKQWSIDNPHEIQSQAIIDELLRNGLAGNVSVTPVGQTFVISGVLNADQLRSLQLLMKRLRKQFPHMVLSYQNVAASNEGSQRLPSPIAAVIHSRTGFYVVLENGERLRTGSRLPNDGEVLALNDHAMALKSGDALINTPFNF